MSQEKEISPSKPAEGEVSPEAVNQEGEPEETSRPKNIILLSDGTGNSSGKLARTNVWRLYQALDLSTSEGQKEQITYYDDGVGTASFKPLALLGGITGWGLKRNVLDLYTFLCRHYKSGDQIYCFGFSRGAFTIRVLAGLIGNQGLVQAATESDLQYLADQAFRAYRACYERSLIKPFRLLRNALLRLWHWRRKRYNPENNADVNITFLGLWDTVAAYGLPFDELTAAWDFIFPLSFPDRNLSNKVERACHALALDDERHSFHPELWNEETEGDGSKRILQVWFAGMHSNLGGGYPDDGMAHVALNWMMDEVEEKLDPAEEKLDPAGIVIPEGLRFIAAERVRLRAAADVNGKMYDSRRGLGGAYRYLPRKLENLTQENRDKKKNRVIIKTPKIHESVFTRINNRVNGYAPIGLPDNYEVVPSPLTEGLPLYVEQDSQKRKRADLQEIVWNLVWWKRLVYFLTVATAIWLLTLPLYSSDTYDWEQGFSFLRPVIGSLSALLPNFLGTWLEAFKRHPGLLSGIVILLLILLKRGSALQRKIFDTMRTIFDGKANDKKAEGFVYTLRTKGEGIAKAVKHKIIPVIILIIALLFIGLAIVRGALIVMDSFGLFSTPTVGTLKESLEKGTLSLEKSVSWASGVDLKKGKRYEITLTRQGDVWSDASIGANFEGFKEPQPKLWWAIPFRRKLSEPWFKPIARIGSTGSDEYPLNPSSGSTDTKLIAEITARRNGELFLFVNDAMLPVWQSGQIFYNNNHGEATVSIKLLD